LCFCFRIGNTKYLYFIFALTTQLASVQTTFCKCVLFFAFRYLKLNDDIYVGAFVIELTCLLEDISSYFVPNTFETVRDVSKALTPAQRRIYRSAARLIRLYLTVPMTNI